jgi:gluconokinase
VDVVLGLDSGTTATKAVAATADARVTAVASVGYPLLVPAPDRAELDPARLVAAGVTALGEVAAAVAAAGDRVVGISLSAAMHGLVPLDAGGVPLGRLLTWADGRAAAEARSLREDGRAVDLHRRTGTPVHPMSPLVKLAWWSARDPDAVRSTPRWGGVKELLLGALCDAGHVVDLSCASATGLYDVHARRWDPEALQVAGVSASQLAEVVPTTRVVGGLRPEVARATALPAGTPVVAGAGDGVLANLGVGAVAEGVAAVSLGTSAALRAVRDRPAVDPAGRLFCYALTDELWVLGGALNNAGSVVRWAAGAFGEGPPLTGEPADEMDARLLAEAGHVPAGSGGLLCLPYLLGERAPWWRSGLRGAYVGLRRDHTRGHLVRAAVEGVCQQLALVRDAFDPAGVAVTEVRATGGAVASPLWRRALADALDLPVRVADSPEGTGLGAALLGFHGLGALDDLQGAANLVAVGEPEAPDPSTARLYRRLRPLVEQSTAALADVLQSLDDLTPADTLPDTADGTATGTADGAAGVTDTGPRLSAAGPADAAEPTPGPPRESASSSPWC